MASVRQPSLPSFAQTFPGIGAGQSGSGQAHPLPPIHPPGSRKRGRVDGEDRSDSGSSPSLKANVKDEEQDEDQEVDMLEPTPPPPALPSQPDTKRRRIAADQQTQASQSQPQRRGSIASLTATSGPSRRGTGHTLPPAPISFAHRRSASKKKPADILISPRARGEMDQFAPAIQSAPPIPSQHRMGMGMGMALPRIPPIGPGVSVRSGQASHIPGRVPPTPTRFTVHASASNAPHPPPPPPPSGPSSVRSPPHASVAISSLRPPPTPHSLTHATYTNEKSAFLAPFEMFYDALNDSKQLKSWLSDQLVKSQALTQSLQHQNDHIGELVENLVERKVGGMRREMAGLQRRVEELEGIIRTDTRNRSHSFSAGSSSGAPPSRYGAGPNESYAFPPIVDRRSAPQQQQPSSPPYARLSTDSPAPYETRRLSISAARLEGPGTPRDASGSIVLPPPLSRNRPSGDVPTLSSTSERERERGRDSEKV